jgi:hypothetical protein
LFPLIKQHLKLNYSNALVHYSNELISLLQRPKQLANGYIIEQLVKFYDYVNSLIDSLSITSNQFKENETSDFVVKLKEMLKWSSTNTNELLIDSISTSSNLSTNNQHSLINLDKLIESLSVNINREADLRLSKKYKFCLNQSKSLIKLLNDSDLLNKSNTFLLSNNLICDDANLKLNDPIRIPSKLELQTYYLKTRPVFKSCDNRDDLRNYENEWMESVSWSSSYLFEAISSSSTTNTLNQEDSEIKLEDLILTYGNDFGAAFINDKDLLKQLVLSFEQQQQIIQHLNQQYQMQDDLNQNMNGDQLNKQNDQVDIICFINLTKDPGI